jgi:hypothetical protein
MWGALSYEKTGLSSTTAAVHRQRRTEKQRQSQSQSYFTTGGLPPISSSWHQAPCDSRPKMFFSLQLSPCGHGPYIIFSKTKGCVCLLWIGFAFVKYTYHIHTACYWKFLLVHCIQVLCQSRLCKADHVYLTYLMLQRQLSHLNSRKLARLQF